uniref:uncharacterized protein LOC124064385 n=1 Tax=Scatophagus argus TaxID=75038 RepID=UPI001ED7FA64|nr:uncharacterized protein LOC124064385 [Scatophagus argus]
MSSIGDEIKLIILKALPNLSEDTQKQVITALEISGAESTEDLKYVQQDDIKDLLPVIQQRKLLEAFRMAATVTLDLQMLPDDSTHASLTSLSSPLPCSSSSLSSLSSSLSSSEPSTPCTSHRLRQSANISSKWHETFEVPWDKIPAPDKRRQMIRIVADEMRKYEVNPTCSECRIICQNIVKQYPSSFADMTTRGVIIAGGFTSLLSQLKTRIENINHAGTLKRHRTSRWSGQLQRPTDSYGCTQFQPDPPPEETNETLEQKRQQLVNIYRQEAVVVTGVAHPPLAWPPFPPLLIGGLVVLLFWLRRCSRSGREVVPDAERIQKTFITGLAAVFATYYVFNLQYQEEAARTLEFVQRYIFLPEILFEYMLPLFPALFRNVELSFIISHAGILPLQLQLLHLSHAYQSIACFLLPALWHGAVQTGHVSLCGALHVLL